MRKRAIALLTATVMCFGVFAGCGTKGNVNKGAGANQTTQGKKFKVGLSTDEGGINDKSFNQSANTGIKKAQDELGFEYKAIESKQKEDYEANLNALVTAKSDLVFAVGYQMESAIKNVAAKYTDKNFVIVDTVVNAANIQSIVFKENEGSFLAGVVAGKMSKSNKIGFIGGKDGELINKFEVGYAAGAKSANPSISVEVRYADSFGDVNKGYELAKELIGKGCDVIYHAAGGVGIGMFNAVKEANAQGKKVWAIGVDMDQAVSVVDANKKPMYEDIILTSMIKRVDTATYNACKQLASGTFTGGNTVTLGLKEEGVGLAPSSSKNTPKEVLDVVDKASAMIKEGKINVPANRDELAKFTAPELK